MRRGIRNLLERKSDKKAGQAAVTEDADDAANEPPDDTALGLDVWAQGVNPIVEYVSLTVLLVSSTCPHRSRYLFVDDS